MASRTGISGSRPNRLELSSYGSLPPVHEPLVALGAGNRYLRRRPEYRWWALPQPTTAGMPSSRAMIAA